MSLGRWYWLGRGWRWAQGMLGVCVALAVLPVVWAVWLGARAVKAAWDICEDSL